MRSRLGCCRPERRARFVEEGHMPILRKLQDFLEQNQVAYTHTVHPLAYTAREVATAERVPAREVAKTVVFLSEHGYAMAVLTGDSVVDLEQLRLDLALARLRLATEAELADLFPPCELGAMPPFGNLYNLSVYVDESLAKCKEIAFNACTHQELLMVMYADFQRLVKPIPLKIAQPAEHRRTAA